jgi:hypothetical protein
VAGRSTQLLGNRSPHDGLAISMEEVVDALLIEEGVTVVHVQPQERGGDACRP